MNAFKVGVLGSGTLGSGPGYRIGLDPRGPGYHLHTIDGWPQHPHNSIIPTLSPPVIST